MEHWNDENKNLISLFHYSLLFSIKCKIKDLMIRRFEKESKITFQLPAYQRHDRQAQLFKFPVGKYSILHSAFQFPFS